MHMACKISLNFINVTRQGQYSQCYLILYYAVTNSSREAFCKCKQTIIVVVISKRVCDT